MRACGRSLEETWVLVNTSNVVRPQWHELTLLLTILQLELAPHPGQRSSVNDDVESPTFTLVYT